MERKFEHNHLELHHIAMICEKILIRRKAKIKLGFQNLLANLKHNLLKKIGKLLNDRHRLARSQANSIHRRRRVVPGKAIL